MILLFSFFSGIAQYTTKKKSAIAKYEEGRKAYAMMNFELSIQLMNEALEKDPNFLQPYHLLAELYLEIQQYDKSLENYRKVLEINPQYNPVLYYTIANIELHTAKYEEAIVHFEKFKELTGVPEPFQKEFNLLIANANFGAEAVKNPVPFDPRNMGQNINTNMDEYHPSITVDSKTFVFTAKDNVGKSNTGKPLIREDLYYSKKSSTNDWGRSVNYRGPINTRYNNEGSSCISHDGKYMFFTACELKTGYGSCDLYMSEMVGGKWKQPVNVGNKINSGAWESHPSLSPDGKSLYFTSNRGGGKGSFDIWRSDKDEEGNWLPAVNLEINTSEGDQTPYIHADGTTLYFSSKGRPGMGEYDLFVTRIRDDGSFTEPQNLGYPINSEKHELGVIADPEGRLAYYASDKEGGYGGLDLYEFELPEKVRPIMTTYIEGNVFDRDSKAKLDAEVELIDLTTEKVITKTTSDKVNGQFLVSLPSNRDYALNVSRSGYLFYSDNFSLKGKKVSSRKLEVPMVQIKAGEAVVLKNVFFETSKFDLKPESKTELNILVQMLKMNTTLKIEIGGHTDNQGNPTSNQKLSEQRAQSVMDYLVSQGIESTRLSSKGFGDTTPITSNDTEEGRAQNRRTEFRVVEQ
tara:strand:+ start:25037 stop:26935 length:1899 start_codon:yes stop_codon:yes gene_type:complete